MRRILFYTISICCALAINLAIISLLVLAAPKNNVQIKTKTLPEEFSLSQKQVRLSIEEKPQQTVTNTTPRTEVLNEKKSPPPPQHLINKKSIEEDIFFSRGNEILASLNETAPKISSFEKKRSALDSFNHNKTHCYCTKTLNHIATYFTALKRQYAKPLAQWYEQVSNKPDVTVHVVKNGSLKSVLLTKSSGSSLHDKLFVQAIKQAAPFPKIPEHFKTNELIFEL